MIYECPTARTVVPRALFESFESTSKSANLSDLQLLFPDSALTIEIHEKQLTRYQLLYCFQYAAGDVFSFFLSASVVLFPVCSAVVVFFSVQVSVVLFPIRCCVCVCVCVFIKLHITSQSSPVILVILCHSH